MTPEGQTQVSAFVATLEKTQSLPPGTLAAYQRRLLEKLVRHARDQTDFYTERLRPLFDTDGSIAWHRWDEIPILTRRDVQDNFDALTARVLPAMAGESNEDTSSGSTGQPVRYLQSGIQHVASACASERFFRWHGLEPTALTARIRAAVSPETAYPAGRTATGWRIGNADSRVIDLSIATSADDQIEWLSRVKPDYLISYPSNLRELARVADSREHRLHFDRVLSFGEMVTDDMTDAIAAHFGMTPLDRYGSTEVGHISGTCPHSLKHHVSSELVLVELLDEGGRPVEPGRSGRVVITPFYGLAMPLLRYDIGDYAILSPEPCGCGRTLPLFEKILGRVRNVFHFEDGSSVWPILLSSQLRKFVSLRQFQTVQRTPTDIEFRYVPGSPEHQPDLDGLRAYIRQRLHPSVNITVSAVERIDRSPGGKFEDYLSTVGRRAATD